MPAPNVLEEYVFSKLYFDPAGLILALDDGQIVGFAHAGFGSAPGKKDLSGDRGILSLIGVRPSHRRQGIGFGVAAPVRSIPEGSWGHDSPGRAPVPLNPFYFGLYGGSDSPGFLASDAAAEPFLKQHGYVPATTCLVFQRALQDPMAVVDVRFPSIRRRFELVAEPRSGVGTWWEECTRGPTEFLDIRLVEKGSERIAGRVLVWEMTSFSQRWQTGAVGVVDLEVRPDLRRQGLARFLIAALLRHLQDQLFAIVEVQMIEQNQAAIALFGDLHFQQIDVGRQYRKM